MKFKSRIRHTGNSDVVTIPSDFVRNKLLQVGEEYWFEVNEKEILP